MGRKIVTDTNAQESLSRSGAKRAARLAAVQMIYQREFGQELHTGLHLEDGDSMAAPDAELLQTIIETANDRRADIDGILTKALDADWPLERLEQILRAILRAGVGELLQSPKTPAALLITDYVDVAHAFFAGKEPGLVNAVLDRIARIVRT